MLFTIKPLQLIHLNQVCEIEANVHAPNYWPRQVFIDELNKDNSAYWVALKDLTVLGYIGFNIICNEGYITNLTVSPEKQGQKIGESLLKYLLQKALAWKIERLTLEVRVSNYKAQNLYKKYGFMVAGLRKKYYQDNNEDGLILWTPQIQDESFKQRFFRD